MKLINKSKRAYMHEKTILAPNQVLEVNDKKMAEVLLKQLGVEEYISVDDVKKLKEENEKLKAEKELEELKKKADELGIEYAKNIGLAKLQAKIDEKLKEKE